MARLIIQTPGIGRQAVEIRLGVNRVGRDPACELHLPHPSVSSHHAEIALSNDGVHLLDHHSTNGTFIDGQPVTDAWLNPGQQLRFGDVELLVESTDASIAIPEFDRTEPAKPVPVILDDGRSSCPRHAATPATFRCTFCKELMCNACVKLIRLQGRPPHFLCRLCSNSAERLDAVVAKKKKGFFAALFEDTVRLKLPHRHDEEEK